MKSSYNYRIFSVVIQFMIILYVLHTNLKSSFGFIRQVCPIVFYSFFDLSRFAHETMPSAVESIYFISFEMVVKVIGECRKFRETTIKHTVHFVLLF